MTELETLLPALGVALPAGIKLEGGSMSVMLAMEPANKLLTAGSLALNNTKLTGFNLPKKLAMIENWRGQERGRTPRSRPWARRSAWRRKGPARRT